MGRKKMLKVLSEFFSMDARSREKHKLELNDVLMRLKQKENELKESLEKEKDESLRQELSQKIDLVHSQRKKGITMLKELKDGGEQEANE